jgi:hypothetical protein|tara:strand:+ start:341 stop:826 length:486 start_codon:yes stop_codon:yes gene_type:complete
MKNFLSIASILILFSSCAIFVDEYQVNQRKVLAYLLSDFPIPGKSEIIKEPTVVLGTGNAVSGRIVLKSSYSPAENLIFWGNSTPETGWQLISSKVAEEISLVYSKEGRFATINITPTTGLGQFITGDYGSDISIAVVHPNAIAEQLPYAGLEYDNLPNLP